MNVIAYEVTPSENSDAVTIRQSNNRDASYIDGHQDDAHKITGDNLVELLDFLYRSFLDCAGHYGMRVFWDLDANVAPLLRLMDIKTLRKLAETHETFCRPYVIFYIPGKVFSLKRVTHHYRLSFYDLNQYFPDAEPPELDLIPEAAHWILDMLKSLNWEPTKLTSPVAIYEQCAMRQMNLPTGWDMPEPAAKLAYQSAGHLWIEAFKLGYFPEAHDYDLRSAFPSVAATLPDFRGCKWIKSQRYQPEAIYGWCPAQVKINKDVLVSPIMYSYNKGQELCARTGTFPTILKKSQMDFIEQWGIGDYKLKPGWWAIPQGELTYPLKDSMEVLMSHRTRDNKAFDLLIKRMATGVYGKTGAMKGDMFDPDYWNPVFFAEIPTRVNLKIAEQVYRHHLQDKLIHIGVDGMLLTSTASLADDWKYKGSMPALIISDGLVYTPGKHPKGLSLELILDMVHANPKESYYHIELTRRVTLADALISGNLNEIGTVKSFHTSLNLNREQGRHYSKLPHTGKQLLSNQYSSTPFNI